MAYQETTRVGYGTRVGNSFRSIGTGFILFAIGTALLWWNEGRVVKTDKMLNEAEGVTVELEGIDRINPEMDGKLVYATGLADTQDSLIDAQFGIGATAISLTRSVEYYQWVEHAQEEHKETMPKMVIQIDKVDATIINNNAAINTNPEPKSDIAEEIVSEEMSGEDEE